jgi:hypothetical protein
LKQRCNLVSIIILTAFLFTVASGCGTLRGKPGRDDLIPGEGDPRVSLLSYSFVRAKKIQDPIDELNAYLSIAAAFSDAGYTGYSEASLNYTIENIYILSDEGERAAMLLSYSRAYQAAGNFSKSRELMEPVLDGIDSIEDELVRGELLRGIISLCFSGDDSFSELIRPAVESVYVIETLGVRIDILLHISELYSGTGGQDNTFIILQQILAAAGSLNEYWRKAEIYAKVAFFFFTLERNDDAERFAQRTLKEVTQAGSRVGEEEKNALLTAAMHLARINLFNDAWDIITTVDDPDFRIQGLLQLSNLMTEQGYADLASTFVRQSEMFLLELNDPYTRLKIQMKLAEAYMVLGRAERALETKDTILAHVMEIEDEEKRILLLYEAIELYMLFGEIEEVIDAVRTVESPVLKSAVYAKTAQFVDAGIDGKVLEMLDEALKLSKFYPYLQDFYFRDLSLAYARLLDFQSFGSIVKKIDDPYLFSIACTAAGFCQLNEGVRLEIRDLF